MEVCRKLGNIKLENRPYTEVSLYLNMLPTRIRNHKTEEMIAILHRVPEILDQMYL